MRLCVTNTAVHSWANDTVTLGTSNIRWKEVWGSKFRKGTNYLDLSGTTAKCPDNTAITQPAGSNPLELVSFAASGRDCGIFHLSNDNAYICNSADGAYLFAVFDTDKT